MIRKAAVVAASVLLCGCFSVRTAQAPVPTTYPLTHQQKMQTAHHWDVLAQHQAGLIAASERLRYQPIYVNVSNATAGSRQESSPFEQAFADLLTSQLVNHGAYVSTDQGSAAQLSYSVQVLQHRDRKDFLRAAEGTWTTLATGIAVATLPYNHWSEPALALIPAAAAVDLFSGGWATRSNREVIITTRIVEDDRVAFSSSNIYYINSGDANHYDAGPRRSRDVPMTETW